MNRDEIARKITAIADSLLRAKGHVAAVDVLVSMGWLAPHDLEAWRMRRVPYLERVIRCNIPRLNAALKALRSHLRSRGLRPSWTAYMSWGKCPRVALQFSRSADPALEEAYATHWLPPKAAAQTHSSPSRAQKPRAQATQPGQSQPIDLDDVPF